MKARVLATALLFATVTATAGDTQVEVRLDAGLPTANAPWMDPMDQLLWAANLEHANLLRGGQPGGAAAPVFLVRVRGGQSPEIIAAALDNGVRIREEVVAEIPWPWKPREMSATDLEVAIGIELGHRLNSRLSGAGKR